MKQLESLRAKRLALIESIVVTADKIAAIDCEIEALQMQYIEDDLIQAGARC